MAEINTRNPEPFEIVGSKDLRESFKEARDNRVRGSFYINGVELHQFEANSPGSVVSQINAKTGQHFVTAEIDDGGHLVLADASGHPIAIREGAPYVDAPPASTGDAAKDVLNALKSEAEKRNREGDKVPSVLEMLGLEVTEKNEDQTANAPMAGFETGRSAEDRKKAREEALKQGVASGATTYPSQPASGPGSSGGPIKAGAQIPSNPTPGNAGGAQGKLDDGRGRSGTGGGQGESAASTVQRTHQGTQPAPVPGA